MRPPAEDFAAGFKRIDRKNYELLNASIIEKKETVPCR